MKRLLLFYLLTCPALVWGKVNIRPDNSKHTPVNSYQLHFYSTAARQDTVRKVLAARLSALRRMASPQPDVIYQISENGGGQFYWNPADTRPDDGAIVIKTAAMGTGRFNRVFSGPVDARWFGVTANVSADNAAALQAAINYAAPNGNQVLLPAGIIMVSSTIELPSGVALRGAGSMLGNVGTTLKRAPGANCVLLRGGDRRRNEALPNAFIALENLVFDGNGNNQTREFNTVELRQMFIGSYIRNIFITNSFGHALDLKDGIDLEGDHLWLLGNRSSDGFAISCNTGGLAGKTEGNLNLNHVYCEYTIKTTNPATDPYAASSLPYRSTPVSVRNVISFNVNELHFEYDGGGVLFRESFIANIRNITGSAIGNGVDDKEGVVQLYDGNALQSLTITKGFNTVPANINKTVKWVVMLNGSSNDFPEAEALNTHAVLSGYAASKLQGSPDATNNVLPITEFTNALYIRRVGGYSPQALYYLDNNKKPLFAIRSGEESLGIAGYRNQTTPYNFLTFNSYGNPGDNAQLSVPLYLGNRRDASYMEAGALFSLSGAPAFSKGNNGYATIATVVQATSAPGQKPEYFGQLWGNNNTKELYVGLGTTTAAEWYKIATQPNVAQLNWRHDLKAAPTRSTAGKKGDVYFDGTGYYVWIADNTVKRILFDPTF